MPDIFDQVAAQKPTGDIFDQVAAPAAPSPPAESGPPPAPPEGYASHYLKSLIDQTKQQWASTQEFRDREAQVAKGVTEAVKKGDFGSAAEMLITHLYHAAGGAAKGLGSNIVAGVMPQSDERDLSKEQPLGAPITPFPGVSGALEGFADETAANAPSMAAKAATAAEPGTVQKIIKGKKVAQAPAQESLKSAAKAGAKEGGASTVQPASLRESLSGPIDSVESAAKQNYQAMDQATGGRFQPNLDKLTNVNNKLKAIAGTDEAKEAELAASKTRLEWQQEQLFDEASAKGVPKQVVETARGQFRQAQAMRDLESRVFKNTSVVAGNVEHGTPETINVNRAVTALQKLQDDTEFGGPRLEQALGKQGAKQLLGDMYAAQRLGVQALSHQQIAKWIGPIVAGSVGLGAVTKGISAGVSALSR